MRPLLGVPGTPGAPGPAIRRLASLLRRRTPATRPRARAVSVRASWPHVHFAHASLSRAKRNGGPVACCGRVSCPSTRDRAGALRGASWGKIAQHFPLASEESGSGRRQRGWGYRLASWSRRQPRQQQQAGGVRATSPGLAATPTRHTRPPPAAGRGAGSGTHSPPCVRLTNPHMDPSGSPPRRLALPRTRRGRDLLHGGTTTRAMAPDTQCRPRRGSGSEAPPDAAPLTPARREDQKQCPSRDWRQLSVYPVPRGIGPSCRLA